MIHTSRAEALVVSRRMLRGFAGAPDVRRHAQQLFGVLIHAGGWSKRDEALIAELGAWLQGRPNLSELKGRCEATVGKLS